MSSMPPCAGKAKGDLKTKSKSKAKAKAKSTSVNEAACVAPAFEPVATGGVPAMDQLQPVMQEPEPQPDAGPPADISFKEVEPAVDASSKRVELTSFKEVVPAAEADMELAVGVEVQPAVETAVDASSMELRAVEPALEPTVGNVVEPAVKLGAVESAVEPTVGDVAEPAVDAAEPAAGDELEPAVVNAVKPAAVELAAVELAAVELAAVELAAVEPAVGDEVETAVDSAVDTAMDTAMDTSPKKPESAVELRQCQFSDDDDYEEPEYNPECAISADQEEDVEIPIVNEKETNITPARQAKGGKNRTYWLQVPLFQIHDEQRQSTILDDIKAAFQDVPAVSYIGVQKARVQQRGHGARLYYMVLLKPAGRNSQLTQASMSQALKDGSGLTDMERSIMVVGVIKQRKPHPNMQVLYLVEQEEEDDEETAVCKREVEADRDYERLYSDLQRGEKRKWAEFEYSIAHEIQDKAAAMHANGNVSMQECLEKVKKQLKTDTGSVFMTRGEAVTKVLVEEKSFVDMDMSTIIAKFWRTQPEYDTARFNHELFQQRATPKEMCAFKVAERKYVAELEEARSG
eukprot:12434-Heterococcus_DN1.PRE.2